MEYIKLFETHADYAAYIGGSDKVLPNVSYCENENEVHYNPWYDPERFVAKFNVTSTTTPTGLFNNPSLLKELEIDGVKYNGNDIFSHTNHTFNTTGIHTVKYTLTDGTTSFDAGSFAGKIDMVSITIPSIITSIGSLAFADCSGLTSITIPNSVTSIGDCLGNFAFEKVKFESINPNATFVVDATNKVLTNIAGDTLICGFNNTVAIPNTVTSIGQYAFGYCRGLTSITIPNSVTSIGNSAFYHCRGLTNVTIGSGVTSIGTGTFQFCDITNITSLATTAPTIQSNTFQNIKTDGTLTVPSGSTGYDVWMNTGNYYLGKYNWTKVEQ